MGKLAYTNGHVSINSVDLSDDAHNVTLDEQADAPEVTGFSSGGNRAYVGGLKTATCTIQFRQDYASSQVDATLNALLGTSVPVALRAVNDTISSTNPEYQFNAIVTGYQPITGAVGDAMNTQITMQVTGAVTRDVTP